MNNQHKRSEILLGKEAMERLFSSRVAVFGLGGVGGSCAEALARAGIGQLDLIDFDTVSESITSISCTDHMTAHALITWMIIH